jgi:hypothetical protein
MRKSVKNSVSSVALAAMLTSGFVGLDAASAQGENDTIKPNRATSVAKKKSNWIFPTVAALAVVAGVLVVTKDDKPASP